MGPRQALSARELAVGLPIGAGRIAGQDGTGATAREPGRGACRGSGPALPVSSG